MFVVALYIYIYLSIYTYIFSVSLSIYIYTYIHNYVYIYIHVYNHTLRDIRMHACARVHAERTKNYLKLFKKTRILCRINCLNCLNF